VRRGRRAAILGGMATTAHIPAPASSGFARLADSEWAPLPVLLAGAFMVVLDFFIVNVALPSMATSLHAGHGALEWVVAGYGLSFAVLLVSAGRIGEQLGQRRVYAAGLALFTAASAACGFASSPGALVGARVVQGAAAALLMPQVLGLIGRLYQGAARTKALGIYGVALGLAAVGGQVIGGALLTLDVGGLGWRLCFLINLPVGALGFAFTRRLVPPVERSPRAPLDVVGTSTLGAAVIALLLPLIDGREQGWPLWTWVSFAVAGVLFVLFTGHQRRLLAAGRNPVLDLRLFRDRSVSAGLVTQLALAAAQGSFFVYLAIYLQGGRHLSPLSSGLVFTAVAVSYVAVSGRATALAQLHGRRVIGTGGIALLAGFLLIALAIDLGGSVALLVPGLALGGAGIGLSYTPLTAIVLSGVAPEQSGAAAGAMATTQQLGGAVGVALTGLIFFASGDLANAFSLSLLELAACAAVVASLARLLPGR
jgi:EmrB/QacA subfamily drug resistance transporter